jgi:hypothetical protein
LKNIFFSLDKWIHGKMGYSLKIMPHTRDMLLKDYGHNLGYPLEGEANECIKKIRAYTMLPYLRLLVLYQQAVFCEKHQIKGSFVECGVWKGGAVGLMALVNSRYGRERRTIHLFDAFDDICQPDASVDGEEAIQSVKRLAGADTETRGELKPIKGIYDSFGGCGSLEENKRLLEEIVGYDSEYLRYHKGWFQDTLPQSASEIEDISILRLDGDWYASIKVCLDYLYSKVVKGGFVIVDDYGYLDGCRKAVDEFLEKNNITVYLNCVDSGCVYWIKP